MNSLVYLFTVKSDGEDSFNTQCFSSFAVKYFVTTIICNSYFDCIIHLIGFIECQITDITWIRKGRLCLLPSCVSSRRVKSWDILAVECFLDLLSITPPRLLMKCQKLLICLEYWRRVASERQIHTSRNKIHWQFFTFGRLHQSVSSYKTNIHETFLFFNYNLF